MTPPRGRAAEQAGWVFAVNYGVLCCFRWTGLSETPVVRYLRHVFLFWFKRPLCVRYPRCCPLTRVMAVPTRAKGLVLEQVYLSLDAAFKEVRRRLFVFVFGWLGVRGVCTRWRAKNHGGLESERPCRQRAAVAVLIIFFTFKVLSAVVHQRYLCATPSMVSRTKASQPPARKQMACAVSQQEPTTATAKMGLLIADDALRAGVSSGSKT